MPRELCQIFPANAAHMLYPNLSNKERKITTEGSVCVRLDLGRFKIAQPNSTCQPAIFYFLFFKLQY